MATLFAPSAALAVGFVLLATCPGGMLSNLFTDMAKGDLALSIALGLVLIALILGLNAAIHGVRCWAARRYG